MRGLWVAAAVALAVSGCQSRSERVSNSDDTYCRSIGAPPGSPDYSQCRLQLRAEQDRREAHFRANPPFRTDNPVTWPAQQQQQQRPVACTTSPNLGNLQTTCN